MNILHKFDLSTSSRTAMSVLEGSLLVLHSPSF